MKVLQNLLKLFIAGAALALTGCSAEVELIQPLEPFQAQAYAKYTQYSAKPVVSALDASLGKVNPTRSADYVVGLTQADLDYLNSLDVDGLGQLKKQLMAENGIGSDEELEKMLDDAYDQLTSQMTDAQIVKYNQFVNKYIEEPTGLTSDAYFNTFKGYLDGTESDEVFITTAVSIDNFGRKLYASKELATRSANPSLCKTIYAAHIAVACIGCTWGFFLPGPGWAVGIAAFCEGITASSNYIICMRTRGFIEE